MRSSRPMLVYTNGRANDARAGEQSEGDPDRVDRREDDVRAVRGAPRGEYGPEVTAVPTGNAHDATERTVGGGMPRARSERRLEVVTYDQASIGKLIGAVEPVALGGAGVARERRPTQRRVAVEEEDGRGGWRLDGSRLRPFSEPRTSTRGADAPCPASCRGRGRARSLPRPGLERETRARRRPPRGGRT